MRKIVLTFVWVLTTLFTDAVYSQVTIGTLDPPQAFSILELVSAPSASVGGLRLPQLDEADKTSLASQLMGATALSKGLFIYNTEKDCIEYWNGTEWIAPGGAGGPWMKAETTDFAALNTDSIYQMGPVAIGHSGAVDPSAILNVKATNQGVLFPRVTLSNTTDVTTILNPTKGLLVFNTGDGGLDYTGYVFWNGMEWVSLTSGSLAPGTIGAITCNSISLTPPIYQAGIFYEGTMTVPYTGANGGVYPAMKLGPVNGLTATLPAGSFSPGAGTLAFHITGTPTVTTPTVTTFSLNIGGKTCAAGIGAGDGIAPGDLVFYASSELPSSAYGSGSATGGNQDQGWMSYYDSNLPVIGGKLRLDGYFSGAITTSGGGVPFNPRLVNISGSNVRFSFSAMTTVDNFNGNNVVLAPGASLNLDNGIYFTAAPNRTTDNAYTGIASTAQNNTEVVTLDLELDNKWYRIYYYPVINNKNQTTAANMTKKVYLSIQRLY